MKNKIIGFITCALLISSGTLSQAKISPTTGKDDNTPWIDIVKLWDTSPTDLAVFVTSLGGAGSLGLTLAAGVGTFLTTPSSANLITAVTDETGTGKLCFATNPAIIGAVMTTGLTASGSASNDFSASTGTFKTSSGVNTFGGSSHTFAAKAIPASDDGAALGDTTHNWSDLFLATGAVVNYQNGNVVLTHTSGVLTLGTGNLIITTAGTAAGSVATISGTQTLTAKTLTSPVIGTGLTASGSAANDFSASTGTFLTSSGANTLSGTTTVAVNKNLLCGTGTSALDFSLGTGVTKTTTGVTTIGGPLVVGNATARSGVGAVAVTSSLAKLTSTGSAQAITLADGVDGQEITIVHDVDGGSMVLTPTTKTGFTTITFTAVGETATLIFVTTRGWMVKSLFLAVAA